jgi:hypothetical protein
MYIVAPFLMLDLITLKDRALLRPMCIICSGLSVVINLVPERVTNRMLVLFQTTTVGINSYRYTNAYESYRMMPNFMFSYIRRCFVVCT